MATREGFDLLQTTMSDALYPLTIAVDGEEGSPGSDLYWQYLYLSLMGSLDYHHLVLFNLSGSAGEDHPFAFNDLMDQNISFGFINSDISFNSLESHLVMPGVFDPNWSLCPNGLIDYPSWDGWPVGDPLLPGYPEYLGNRLPVLMRGMLVRMDSIAGDVSGDEWATISYSRAFDETMRPDDLYDIRVYRIRTSTAGVPSGDVYEMERVASDPSIGFKLGENAGDTVPFGTPIFYIVVWASPDEYVETSPPPTGTPSYSSFVTATLYEQRDLFDSNRYDLITYDTDNRHWMRDERSTRFQITDGSPAHYDEENPIFYQLPALTGSLDPDAGTGGVPGPGPFIGWMWAYGYSLDQGDDNPADRNVVRGVILCYQAKAGETTMYRVIAGPDVPPEFQPGDWADFAYYPPCPDDYRLFAKFVIRQTEYGNDAAYRPKVYIEHCETIPSYGTLPLDSVSFADRVTADMYGKSNYYVGMLNLSQSFILNPVFFSTPPIQPLLSGMISMTSQVAQGRQGTLFNSYWKMPYDHPTQDIVDVDAITVHDYLIEQGSEYHMQLELDAGVRDSVADLYFNQISTILCTFSTNQDEGDIGLTNDPNKILHLPSSLEIHFPVNINSYAETNLDDLTMDYSLRMRLRTQTNDEMIKDLFLGASSFYISDDRAAEMLSEGISRDAYLWPSKLDGIQNWILYGRSMFIPDAKTGETQPIIMRQFKPRDPSLPTYEEFLAAEQERYANDLDSGDQARIDRANEQIQDDISDQEYLYGGFDEPDTRSWSASFTKMKEMLLGVTLYNQTGIGYWQNTSRKWGGDHPTVELYDIETGLLRTRYGFRVDDDWYYQSFTQDDVSAERESYIAAHPPDDLVLQEQIEDAGTPNYEFAIDGTNMILATTFTADFVDVESKVSRVSLKIRKVGNPSAKLLATLSETDISTKAPTTNIQTSNYISTDDLGEDFAWVEFTFTNPVALTDAARYAICLFQSDPLGDSEIIDSDNRIEWAFADQSIHSYGVTETSSTLTAALAMGSSSITVADGSVFPSSSFYVKLKAETILISTRTGNILTLSSPTTKAHIVGTRVYEVVFVPTDSELRWVLIYDDPNYVWEGSPVLTNPSYDATYELMRPEIVIDLVEQVPAERWGGTDIDLTGAVNDAFYIIPSDQDYDTEEEPLFGTLGGLEPLGGFNVATTYDFPPMNTFRCGVANITDGYICWTSRTLDDPSTFSLIGPAENVSNVVTYIPTASDMYITALLRRADGTRKAVTKKMDAGATGKVLLDSEEFVAVDVLWVDASEFKQLPYYGYGPTERFVVRSV